MSTPKPFDIPNEKTYSVAEVVEITGVKKSSIYRYIKSGDLRAGHHKRNKYTFVTGREINRFWNATL